MLARYHKSELIRQHLPRLSSSTLNLKLDLNLDLNLNLNLDLDLDLNLSLNLNLNLNLNLDLYGFCVRKKCWHMGRHTWHMGRHTQIWVHARPWTQKSGSTPGRELNSNMV